MRFFYGSHVIFGFIPSPSDGQLHIWQLSLHAYGLCIATGVLAAVWLVNRRWTAQGGNTEDVTTLATWGVPAGIIGARIYHVITDWEQYRNQPLHAFYIWDGGLGIWGGIALGVGVGLIVAKNRDLPLGPLLDVTAPALALAQAIGRIGNYFNQELFGKPTTLPWGLRIDYANRPFRYEQYMTFHPTFLYEALWNIVLCIVLIAYSNRHSIRPGTVFLLYVGGYTFARFFIERLRIDPAHTLGGMRINEWTSLVIFLTAMTILIIRSRMALSGD